MDKDLINASIDFHGPQLIDDLAQEHDNIELPNFLSINPQGLSVENQNDKDFRNQLTHFISKKADLLFKKQQNKSFRLKNQKLPDDFFSVIPPLETFLNLPKTQVYENAIKSLSPGDVVIGTVSAVLDRGIFVLLNCLDGTKYRDFSNIRLTAFCSARDLPRLHTHDRSSFTVKDQVRGVIKFIDQDSAEISISLIPSSSDTDQPSLKLGLIDSEDVPLYYRLVKKHGVQTFADYLTTASGFSNTDVVDNLSDLLSLNSSTAPTLLRSLRGHTDRTSTEAESLRKKQTLNWSMKSVEEGIVYFKEGDLIQAMQHLTKALKIDPDNVEALVARGALYANKESFSRAIEDFEKAIKLNPKHHNAINYMCETLKALGKNALELGDDNEAIRHFEKVLEFDPKDTTSYLIIGKIREKLLKEQEEVNKSKIVYSENEDSDCNDEQLLQKASDTLRQIVNQERTSQHVLTISSSKQKKSRRDSSSSSSSSLSSSSSFSSSSPSSSGLRRKSAQKPRKLVSHPSSRELATRDSRRVSLVYSSTPDELEWVEKSALSQPTREHIPPNKRRLSTNGFSSFDQNKRDALVFKDDISPSHRGLNRNQANFLHEKHGRRSSPDIAVSSVNHAQNTYTDQQSHKKTCDSRFGNMEKSVCDSGNSETKSPGDRLKSAATSEKTSTMIPRILLGVKKDKILTKDANKIKKVLPKGITKQVSKHDSNVLRNKNDKMSDPSSSHQGADSTKLHKQGSLSHRSRSPRLRRSRSSRSLSHGRSYKHRRSRSRSYSRSRHNRRSRSCSRSPRRGARYDSRSPYSRNRSYRRQSSRYQSRDHYSARRSSRDYRPSRSRYQGRQRSSYNSSRSRSLSRSRSNSSSRRSVSRSGSPKRCQADKTPVRPSSNNNAKVSNASFVTADKSTAAVVAPAVTPTSSAAAASVPVVINQVSSVTPSVSQSKNATVKSKPADSVKQSEKDDATSDSLNEMEQFLEQLKKNKKMSLKK